MGACLAGISGGGTARNPMDTRHGTARNPMDTRQFWVPPMTPDEVAQISVPLAEVGERLPAVMAKHGVALVEGVVGDEQLAELEGLWAEDLAEIAGGFSAAAGPRAFPNEAAKQLCGGGAGFILDKALPHGRFAWAARTNPNVHAAFRALFPGSTDLVTSLDANFFSPEGNAAKSNQFSAHCDQNRHDVRPTLADVDIYQGVLYVWPSGSEGSTTVVWPGSHLSAWPKMMDAGIRNAGRQGFHYCEIGGMTGKDSAVGRELAAGWVREARRAVVPAGSLFLWNSRTLHTGWKAGSRLAQPVCLEPVERRSPKERLAKMRLAALGLPGTHWASYGMQHDMCLGAPGIFNEPQRAGSFEARPALRPVALADGADMKALKQLVEVEYYHTGLWACPEEHEPLLEASIREEYKPFL